MRNAFVIRETPEHRDSHTQRRDIPAIRFYRAPLLERIINWVIGAR